MEEKQKRKPHCLVLLFPAQGHINPMLQFSKRLEHKGVRITLVSTRFLLKTLKIDQLTSMPLESISDGYDDGGYEEAGSDKEYIDSFSEVGSKTFEELIQKLTSCGNLVDCVVYDSFLPWAIEGAKKYGIMGAAFFTQSCVVNSLYYHAYHGNLKIPLTDSDDKSEISLPALPTLAASDLPSFFDASAPYQSFTKMLVNQFSDVEKADWVFCNSFYELETQVVDWQAKIFPLKTVGPTIPSMFLDKRIKDDSAYSLSIFKEEINVLKWLSDKPSGSVVYVSFGSLIVRNTEQMEEMAWGLKDSESYFLWVVRESEKPKLPKGFLDISQNNHKGLVVTWCPQVQVLNHEAVGCFVTHCGWNSTLEAVSLGVPMVAVPHLSDQPTNAKCIKDVWNMGVRAEADEKGVVRRETIKKCIEIVMKGERGKEIKMNAMKWKTLAVKACDEGGSTDKNIDDFVASFVPFTI